jgi:hypothetical protein
LDVSNNLIKPLLWYYSEVTPVFGILPGLHKLQEIPWQNIFVVGKEEGGIKERKRD